MRLRIVMILLLACFTVASVTLTGEAAAPAEPYHEIWITVGSAKEASELAGHGILVHEVADGVVRAWVPESTIGLLNRVGIGYRPVESPAELPESGKQSQLSYLSYDQMRFSLQNYHSLYPDITRLYTLGRSVEGREIWALLITVNPDVLEDKPAFKYVSTMHGDEPVGTPLMMQLIDRLLTGYMVDPRMTALVNETEIWIVPLMNPDGYERTPARIRRNANLVDLNRNFPVFPAEFTGFQFDGAPLRDAGREPETRHVMRWSAENSFVLSANIHTGALVVNYPYDDDGKGSAFSPTPDEDVFVHVSTVYAQNNPPMFASNQFENGITNGADWFKIDGGMQDWNYRYLGCMEVTLELSVSKSPPASQLAQLWENNEESLLAYMEQVHIGVRGIVTDADTGEPLYARVRVHDREQPVFTRPEVGNYHRLLLPGEYTLTFEAPFYLPRTVTGVVVEEGPATRLDVTLERDLSIVETPNLVGLTREAAEAALSQTGLALGAVTEQANAGTPRGTVLAQSVTPGTLVTVGSEIGITVSLGVVGVVAIRVKVAETQAPFTEAVLEVDPPWFSLNHAGNGLYNASAAPVGQYTITVVDAGPYQLPPPEVITVLPSAVVSRDIFLESLAGDINGDGAIDALDVQLVINAALGLDIGGFDADVNGDGVVNAVDVQIVINTALGISND